MSERVSNLLIVCLCLTTVVLNAPLSDVRALVSVVTAILCVNLLASANNVKID